METVDELMTPGCPQCAIKHLSAALYHVAKEGAANTLPPDPYMVCVCTAYINLVEVKAGYLSHLWYAVGALVRAEECMAMVFGECVARKARLLIEEHGLGAVLDAMHAIGQGTAPNHAEWAAAHYAEAMRELPAMQAAMRMDDLIGSIERIRKEYFEFEDEATAAPKGKAEKGGECDMTKKTMKKAAAKATKAALKAAPAKAKKAACKGGKTCKSCKK